MITGATLFTGGGGVDIGMRDAGIETAWGLEYDPEIADVARANDVPVMVGDVLDANPRQFERVDVLHASPPCPNFSTAKTGGSETQHDRDLAHAIGDFLRMLTPRFFTMENVYAYRRSDSFRIILAVLRDAGYMYAWDHVNSADYGVPQTRRRLILRAVRGGLVPIPPPAMTWRGWLSSIDDLIDDLPESQFAPWQRERLPKTLKTMLVANGGFRDEVVVRESGQPAFTITANTNQTGIRAFVVAPNSNPHSRGGNMRFSNEPNFTITPNAQGRMKAFLVDGQNCRPQGTITIRSGHEPAFTLMAQGKQRMRAFLVSDQYSQSNSSPERTVQTRDMDDPALTVRASYKGDWRAWLGMGRVVVMTPRALARFQSFPDDYELPNGRGLACRVIGNAVPPLLYRRVIEGVLTTR